MPCEKGAIFSSLPKTNRGSPTVLKGDPKGKNFLYTNGTSVFIRDIENPAISDVYTQHAHNATVAVYAPSGFYIASADSAGKVRIWDTTQAEHILKYEYQPLGGPIKDIAWSPDSKRIVVAGEGREKFGHVFLWDTGASVGDVNGHSKSINAVDYRPERPFRIVTASEDTEVGFFAGPPFKFHHLNKGHTNFVNCVKYSPDGSLFASGGADGKIYIYDGKEGDNGVSLGGERAHKGGIYGLSWSGDGKKLLSASADKTAKIWDIATETASTEFTFGNTIDDQQLGCLWQGDYLLTVSLSACINYLDVNNPSCPRRILAGHNKNILSLASTADGSTLYTGSFDSRICQWNVQSGEAKIFKGKGHTNQISDMALCGENFLVTCSMDDTVRLTDLQTLEYGSCAFTSKDFDHPVEGTPEKDCWQDWHHFNLKMTSAQDVEPSVTSKGPSQDSFDPDDQIPQRYAAPVFKLFSRMGSQPRGVASGKDDLVVVACIKEVAVLREGNPVFSLPVDYEPLCVAVHPGQTEVAVGGMTKYVYIYTLESNTLVEKTKLELTVNVMSVWALAYSPDGAWLATGDNDKKVNIFDSVKNSKKNYLEAHNARVTCLAWSPDSRLLASGGLDTNIFIYNMDDKSKSKMEIKGAHPQGVISRISWLSNNRLVSVGHDCCVRFWTVTE